ncbi:hypothetical protein [Bacillus clarus]|uniref:Uncharacterized protein n=1 Tax=Bacillus clarus TaxID=2338372 RepID=A0A090Y976_9BACI|nr:hypothetical protein [Bacillus clarus]KFM95004.1 hypothetical protein DJ93_5790 [Bacillus clarus]
MKDVYTYLEELQNDIFSLSFNDIEQKYYQICVQLSGIEYAQEIHTIDMTRYENYLEKNL